MSAGELVLQAEAVCPEGCCVATYDPTLGFDPQDPPLGALYSRPMFQVLPDDGTFFAISPEAMEINADEYARPDRIFL